MKTRILLFITISLFLLSNCGGTYSVSSGQADQAAVCFVAPKSFDIVVDIDGVSYKTRTIREDPYRASRSIKKTANRQISVTAGRHKVQVKKNNQNIYSKEIFVSATEVKIIEL